MISASCSNLCHSTKTETGRFVGPNGREITVLDTSDSVLLSGQCVLYKKRKGRNRCHHSPARICDFWCLYCIYCYCAADMWQGLIPNFRKSLHLCLSERFYEAKTFPTLQSIRPSLLKMTWSWARGTLRSKITVSHCWESNRWAQIKLLFNLFSFNRQFVRAHLWALNSRLNHSNF